MAAAAPPLPVITLNTRPQRLYLPATLLVVALLGAACAFEVASKPPLTREDLLQSADAVRASPKTRAEVHELLGEPWIAGGRWPVEVFRTQRKQRKWLVVLAPYPVPIPSPSGKLKGYTLVSYTPAGSVEAIDAGLVDDSTLRPLVLRAGDFTFVHADPKSESLRVSLDRFLRDRPPLNGDESLLLLGCPRITVNSLSTAAPGPLCWTRAQIDDRPPEEYQVRMLTFEPVAPAGSVEPAGNGPTAEQCVARGGLLQNGGCVAWHSAIVPLLVAAGRHRLRLSNRAVDGEVVASAIAPAAGLTYAVETGNVLPSAGHALIARLRSEGGAVEYSAETPAALRDQPVLLHGGGSWLQAARAEGRAP